MHEISVSRQRTQATARPVDVVLLSTYELGRQPFGLASPRAWLEEAGMTVDAQDLAVHALDPDPVRGARVVGIYVPMHTATRLAEPLLGRVRELNPSAHVVLFGLYGPLNRDRLLAGGADSVIGGEYEEALLEICRTVLADGADGIDPAPVSTAHQRFRVPSRAGLPDLRRYAGIVIDGERRVVGSTEASRGCKHSCRHCPIVPVYRGTFRIVDPDVVLADISAQVDSGARHITFGDPDFLNGPAHAMRIVKGLDERFGDLTYDVTIKIEHLLKHRDLLPELKGTGCVLVTSAIESFDDLVLDRLDKGHTADDIDETVALMRSLGLALNPTFVAFTPWTTVEGYLHFLRRIAALDLVEAVSPVQYGIRLLITAGSRLLELDDVDGLVGDLDETALAYPWVHPDPEVDRIHRSVMATVARARSDGRSRAEVFGSIWGAAGGAGAPPVMEPKPAVTVPYLTEPWYC